MTINSMTKGDALGVVLEGVLDYDSANELKEFFSDNIQAADKLIIDMKKIDYISSAGMRVILEAELTMKKKGGMTLKNVNDMVMKAFKTSGFDRFLNIQN